MSLAQRCLQVVAVVLPQAVVTANLGDSRGVLCRSGPNLNQLCSSHAGCDPQLRRSGGTPISLSFDHKPDTPAEQQRIEAAGGRVTPSSYRDCARVWAASGSFGLAMSRALGDFALKAKGEARAALLETDPEITIVQVPGIELGAAADCGGVRREVLKTSS